MNVLITYSSGYGATKEVAEKVSRILAEEPRFKIATISIDDVETIGDYDAVIVGSSVRADRPLANVRDFFARYADVLPEKHLVIFAVCLAANNKDGREKVKQEYLSQITKKYPALAPLRTEAFGGKIDFEKLNPVMQQLMNRVLEKTGIRTHGTVDTRDWGFIESWAVDLRQQLAKAA